MLTLAIPNRNGAQFLERTLVSLDRNRPHVRWWFQDSCSTDESVAIARRYAGPDDRIVVERDSSQTNGLNRAIGRMGGEIIGFLNSDDCLTDGAAETVLATFRDHPEVDMVYGEVEWIDAEDRSQGFHSGEIANLADVLDIYRVWWRNKQWVQPEVFWRRSVWERVGALNEAYNLAFDYEYWVRCFQHGVKVKKIDRVLARFRKHAAQKSTQSAQAAAEIRKIVSDALASAPAIGNGNARRLRHRLEYDRYQCAEDGGAREPFWRALGSHPHWVMLPEVRSRLRQSSLGSKGRA